MANKISKISVLGTQYNITVTPELDDATTNYIPALFDNNANNADSNRIKYTSLVGVIPTEAKFKAAKYALEMVDGQGAGLGEATVTVQATADGGWVWGD